MVGLSCGLKGLDDITAGLAPGDLIILAGRPSMGKTAFALNIAEHVGRGLAKPTLVFSLEQPRQQLLDRVMANLTGISHEHLRKGTLAEGDYPRVTAAMGQLQESQLYIDDSGSQTVVDLRAKARRVKHRHGLGLVIVDYLQLVDPVHRSDTRANDVSEISKGLKAMAKELGVPVIALAQLNRALEARDDKRPRVSDLRESGSIEQDADVIVFLYRHAAYDRMFLLPTVTELHIAKQRNGPLGVVYAHFFGEHMRFRDADRESVSHYQALMSAPKTRRRAMHPDDVPSGRERAQGRDA